MTVSSTCAALSGRCAPCSQSRTVPSGRWNRAANSSCVKFSLWRNACTVGTRRARASCASVAGRRSGTDGSMALLVTHGVEGPPIRLGRPLRTELKSRDTSFFHAKMRLRIETGRARTRSSVKVVTAVTIVFWSGSSSSTPTTSPPTAAPPASSSWSPSRAFFAGAYWWLARASRPAATTRFLAAGAPTATAQGTGRAGDGVWTTVFLGAVRRGSASGSPGACVPAPAPHPVALHRLQPPYPALTRSTESGRTGGGAGQAPGPPTLEGFGLDLGTCEPTPGSSAPACDAHLGAKITSAGAPAAVPRRHCPAVRPRPGSPSRSGCSAVLAHPRLRSPGSSDLTSPCATTPHTPPRLRASRSVPTSTSSPSASPAAWAPKPPSSKRPASVTRGRSGCCAAPSTSPRSKGPPSVAGPRPARRRPAGSCLRRARGQRSRWPERGRQGPRLDRDEGRHAAAPSSSPKPRPKPKPPPNAWPSRPSCCCSGSCCSSGSPP